MTFQDFIDKYNGKGIDFDQSYGFQCMDLMHQYIVDVLEEADPAILRAPDAKTVYQKFPNITGSELFTKVDNTPDNLPLKGDIMFWGYNPSGHVAIFIEGDTNTFTSFDQNFPIGSKCHKQIHNYSAVLGWLRAKKASQSLPEPPEQEFSMREQFRLLFSVLHSNPNPTEADVDGAVGSVLTPYEYGVQDLNNRVIAQTIEPLKVILAQYEQKLQEAENEIAKLKEQIQSGMENPPPQGEGGDGSPTSTPPVPGNSGSIGNSDPLRTLYQQILRLVNWLFGRKG